MLKTGNILDDFQLMTNKDLRLYLQNCITFFQVYYNSITGFFSGNVKQLNGSAFNAFLNIKKQNAEIFEVIHNNSSQMQDTRWWDLISQLEDIDTRLATLDKAAKWARSSMNLSSYNAGTSISYILGQNESLERVSQNVLGSSNPQDDWIDIALSNNLREEDYTLAGGVNLLLATENTLRSFTVNSVVDVISGKSIYGKDLNQNLTFQDDDLLVLDYDDTVMQSVNILINLRKNDNPDFRKLGLQKAVAVGTNRSTLNFPVINRQLSETFASDDTLKNFNINNISYDQDNLFVNYSVQTRLDEVITEQSPL